MTEFILTNEHFLRLATFAGVFIVMALWEFSSPRRRQDVPRITRWPSNLAVVALDTVIVRIVFPMTAIALAMLCEAKGWGLFYVWDVPYWLAVLLAIVVLDMVIYFQHVMFHAVPALWRLHRMHHADLEIDVTTGIRFHPIEILISMVIKFMAIVALGAPAVAVLIFEVLLNATAMFNHANVRIPSGIDRILRWFIVTPDMHRVHHSVIRRETNSNFGFNLPWWDRMFGTYRDQPTAGHQGMTIGIEQFRDEQEQRLDRMLTQPFRDEDVGYAIGGDEDAEQK